MHPLAKTAKCPPVTHGKFTALWELPHHYVCHTAAVYWACRTIRWSDSKAAADAERIMTVLCKRCAGEVVDKFAAHDCHPKWYGEKILKVAGAEPLLNYGDAAVGDVVLFGQTWDAPSHTVVVVKVKGGTAYVRGFNNAGAFGSQAPNRNAGLLRDVYDKEDRDLSTNDYAKQKLGSTFRVGGTAFILAVSSLLKQLKSNKK